VKDKGIVKTDSLVRLSKPARAEYRTAVVKRKGEYVEIPYQTVLWQRRKRQKQLKRARKRRCIDLALRLFSGDAAQAQRYLKGMTKYGLRRIDLLERGRWRFVENELKKNLEKLEKALSQ